MLTIQQARKIVSDCLRVKLRGVIKDVKAGQRLVTLLALTTERNSSDLS